MRVITPGIAPANKLATGRCGQCGCVVEATLGECTAQCERDETLYWVACPTDGCKQLGSFTRIWCKVKQPVETRK